MTYGTDYVLSLIDSGYTTNTDMALHILGYSTDTKIHCLTADERRKLREEYYRVRKKLVRLRKDREIDYTTKGRIFYYHRA